MKPLEKEILHYLQAFPLDIYDEWEEHVMGADRWRLKKPRKVNGVYTNKIGCFNIWLASKAVSDALETSIGDDIAVDTLLSICDNLTSKGLLVESPEARREKFNLITNEELNARREERGPVSRPEHD